MDGLMDGLVDGAIDGLMNGRLGEEGLRRKRWVSEVRRGEAK